MKRSLLIVTLLCLAALAALTWAGRDWSLFHIRDVTGRSDLGWVSCYNCHLVRLEKMPWAKPRPHHDAPAGLVVSPDGTRLYVALDDRDELAVVETGSRKITQRIKVSGNPTCLVLDPKGERLFVTCRGEDRLAVVDTKALKEVGSIEVGLLPAGLAYCETTAGPRLVVANSGSDDLSVLSVSPLAEMARPVAGREPYAVATVRGGELAVVSCRLASVKNLEAVAATEVTVVNPALGRVVARETLDSAHLSEGVAFVPSRSWVLTPLVKVRNLVPITQVAKGWVMSSGFAVSDLRGTLVQMPLDEANDYFADPSAIVSDPVGQRAYIASGGSDTVSVVDLDRLSAWLRKADAHDRREAIYDLTLSPEYVLARIPTARNPRQLALSPDGKTLFIAEHLADSVLAVDTSTLQPLGRVPLGDGGLNDPIRRGERVFTQAAHTFQREFSCRSCHPDAHVDGLAYDFDGDGIGDNLLDNRSLQGVAGTGPFKWNGKNPSLQIQCGPRFARVLMRTDPIPPKDLDDLVAFIEAQPPARTVCKSRLGKALTETQERGRQTFFATQRPDGTPIPRERQCHTCHRPPLFSNRLPSDIASNGPYDSTNFFDTPHLLGVASTAPYLHDGRAKTLEELWTVYQTNDMHGVSSYMNKHQLNELIEYLKTL
jgi:YVTN family beta-propeller protein